MSKYGEKVYDGSNIIKTKNVGKHICPVCKKESILFERKGYGFKNILSICAKNHTVELKKELYEKYYVGDIVRLYESTFGKDAVIRLDCYKEGIVIKTYPNIIDYAFDMEVTKCVFNGEELPQTAWVIGSTWHGISHSSRKVKLIKRGHNPNAAPRR